MELLDESDGSIDEPVAMELLDESDGSIDESAIMQLSDESDNGIHEMDAGTRLLKLTNLRDNVQWEVEYNRHRFLRKLYPLVRHWERDLPHLLRIFRAEQIDRLLWDAVTCTHSSELGLRRSFISEAFVKFVARCGYRDQLGVNQNGEMSSRRTTALHYAIHEWNLYIVNWLFVIYDEYDVNYTDGSGLTHLSAACIMGSDAVVGRFLDRGHDVDLRHERTGDSLLHVALHRFRDDTARLLLTRGANPNLPNARGETPLHLMSKSFCDRGFNTMQKFFEVTRELGLLVTIDARDRSGWTPLQSAVANAQPRLVQLLLDHGADRSSFTFPTESHLLVTFLPRLFHCHSSLQRAAGLLESIRKFPPAEDEECILVQREAMSVMSLFARYRWFETKEDRESRWYDEEMFQREATEPGVLPRIHGWTDKQNETPMSLSLNDLVRLSPQDATAKLLTYQHYVGMNYSSMMPNRYWELIARNLCEKMARSFYQNYTKEPLYELLGYRLPIEVCKMVLSELTNEDLFNICLAAEMMREKKKVRRTDRCVAIKLLGVAGERRRKILDRNRGAFRSRLEKLRNVQKSYS